MSKEVKVEFRKVDRMQGIMEGLKNTVQATYSTTPFGWLQLLRIMTETGVSVTDLFPALRESLLRAG